MPESNRCRYRVIYADTDQMGVVYHANYLAFMERGRCEYMRDRAFNYAAFEQLGYFLPVVEAQARYRVPAKFDDDVIIETTMTEASLITATFAYRIMRSEAAPTGDVERLLVEGKTVHACINKEGRPVRFPREMAPLFPASLLTQLGLSAP